MKIGPDKTEIKTNNFDGFQRQTDQDKMSKARSSGELQISSLKRGPNQLAQTTATLSKANIIRKDKNVLLLSKANLVR